MQTPARPAQDSAQGDRAGPWLVLMHQIPPKPDYLRVKIGRRLQQIGALPIKNSVYVLPNRPQCQEDFQWVVREIAASGGQAWLTTSEFVDGLRDSDVRTLFDTDRAMQYKAIGAQAKVLRRGRRSRDEIPAGVDALRRRLEAVTAADFFGARGRAAAEAAIAELSRARRARLRAPSAG
ncbi:MAG TPA: Chromate resistance protein ChrB, partial [Gemmatimonadaceae bacterium]|nr:Chromate resistance protein ChrB [Gemmatimonadaceae bacterium]